MHDHYPHSHNHNKPSAQWQTPHDPDHQHVEPDHHHEPDLDLVEQSFVEGFHAASDPTSFLRLSGIAMEAEKDGKTYQLVRVEQIQKTDIGSLTPHLGGQTHRYDPLPSQLVAKRDALEFIYYDGEKPVTLSFEEARALGLTY